MSEKQLNTTTLTLHSKERWQVWQNKQKLFSGTKAECMEFRRVQQEKITFAKKKAEREQLEADIKLLNELMISRSKHFDKIVAFKNTIITELADVLYLYKVQFGLPGDFSLTRDEVSELIQRAREAAKEPGDHS